jgi:YfiH family protein
VTPPSPITHPLLVTCGVAHGFGVRGAPAPAGLLRPRQVHGTAVAEAEAAGLHPGEADAVVSTLPGRPVGVATADCLPLLMAARDGRAVAAVHAGWRGLAAGVIGAALDALRQRAATPIVAVVGPRIGPCCYEVDAPVWEALRPRFGADLDGALRRNRADHALLDLAALARLELLRGGLASSDVAALADACTRCDPLRFHSYRRDGERAGRLLHHVAARAASPGGETAS